MFIQSYLENAAATIVSNSLASASITNWQINTGLGTNSINFPCVKIICHTFDPLYKELNLGIGKAHLELITCGIKAIGTNGEGTAATEFEAVSDLVFNPFFNNSIAASMTTASLQVLLVSDEGLDVNTLNDGWMASQKFEVVCGRTS